MDMHVHGSGPIQTERPTSVKHPRNMEELIKLGGLCPAKTGEARLFFWYMNTGYPVYVFDTKTREVLPVCSLLPNAFMFSGEKERVCTHDKDGFLWCLEIGDYRFKIDGQEAAFASFYRHISPHPSDKSGLIIYIPK